MKLEYIVYVFALLNLVYLADCLRVWLFVRRKQVKPGSVLLPGYVLMVGVVCVLFFVSCAFMSVSIGDGAEKWAFCVFAGFALLGDVLVIKWRNFVLTYDNEGFEVRNFFGVCRRYRYHEITGMRNSLDTIKLLIGRHRVSIEIIADGSDKFIRTVQKKCTLSRVGKAFHQEGSR